MAQIRMFNKTIYVDIETGEIIANKKAQIKTKWRKISYEEKTEIITKKNYTYGLRTRTWIIRQHEQYRFTF